MANIGRALLAGAAAGLKSAADQVAEDRKLDNSVRLMAIEDMMKQRASERGHEWDIEKINLQNKNTIDAEDRLIKQKTDPELSKKIAEANKAGKMVEDDYSREQLLKNAGDPTILDATRKLAEAGVPYGDKKMDIERQKAETDAKRLAASDSNAYVKAQTALERQQHNAFKIKMDALQAQQKELRSQLQSVPQGTPEYNALKAEYEANAQLIRGGLGAMSQAGNVSKTSGQSSNLPTDDVKKLVTQSAIDLNIDPALMHGIVKTESNYKIKARNPNSTATGLMQVIPRYHNTTIDDQLDPNTSLQTGGKFLKTLIDKYGDTDKAIAAYYLGEPDFEKYGSVDKLPSEVKAYIASVKNNIEEFRAKNNPADYNQLSAKNPENVLSPYKSDGLIAQAPKKKPEAPQPTIDFSQKAKEQIFKLVTDEKIPDYPTFDTVSRHLLQKNGGNEVAAMMGGMTARPSINKEGKAIAGEFILSNGERVNILSKELAALDAAKQAKSGKDKPKDNTVEQQTKEKPDYTKQPFVDKGKPVKLSDEEASYMKGLFISGLNDDQRKMFKKLDERRQQEIMKIENFNDRIEVINKYLKFNG
jgi:soluble lytic murein transglycosylase-like protein